jgi:hypothetical protein
MQPCNRIYYSTVHWRLNMIRAAYRSSSGALTVFAASGLHTHVVTGRSENWVTTQTWLRQVTTCVCKPEAANKVRAPDDERYAARNMLSCQRTVEEQILLQGCILLVIYYKVASCWLFLLSCNYKLLSFK